MQNDLFTESLKQSKGMRVFLFLIILFVSAMVGIGISALFVADNGTGMRISQGIMSIMMFVVPPIVYYFITRKEHFMQKLGFRKLTAPWWLIIIGVGLMFVSLPVTNLLTEWNENMRLGGLFQRLEDYLKALEQSATDVTERMLNVDTFGGLVFNLIVIALIPAIGEEMTFRGVLQQSLTRGLKNPHIAILLSAAIFSFIHFQFYGFLPRMFLGILLGYMFYTSGSLWTSIVMHFVNNGTAVVLYYLYYKGIINIDAEHFGETQNISLIATSMAATVMLIVWSWNSNQSPDKKENRGA